jgi:hypothetical protein
MEPVLQLADGLRQDLTHAIRTIARSPGFAFVGIGSLARAIAANTIVFGVLNGLILRPLPVESLRSRAR